MSARVADRLRLHFWKAAAAAGVGARGRVWSMCLVVEAADLLDSPSIAEDTRGDTFPAKLAVIAEGRNAPGAGRVGCGFVLEPCLFLDGSQPVDAFGSHRLVDLAGCETRPKLLAHLLAIRGIDGRAG